MADVGKFFGSMFGSAAGAANPVSPAAAIVDGAAKIIGMFKLSPELKATLEQQLDLAHVDMEKAELAAQVASFQGQLDINKAEAESTNWFVAGWRPAVGWVCVVALGYAYVVQPFIVFAIACFHRTLPSELPHLDTGTLISGLLIPLLGIAGLRTIEKVTGSEGNR
jgi:hypothetical protein